MYDDEHPLEDVAVWNDIDQVHDRHGVQKRRTCHAPDQYIYADVKGLNDYRLAPVDLSECCSKY